LGLPKRRNPQSHEHTMTCGKFGPKWNCFSRGDWYCRTGQWRTNENARVDIAGLDIVGPVWQGSSMTDDLRTGAIWLVIDVVDQLASRMKKSSFNSHYRRQRRKITNIIMEKNDSRIIEIWKSQANDIFKQW